MFCQGCGTEYSSDAPFCSNCGRARQAAAVSVEPTGYANPAPSYQVAQAQTTSGLAIGAIITVLFLPFIGLILGYVARNDIRSTKPPKGGEGLATAAIVIGWIFTIFGGVLFFFLIMFWEEFMIGFNEGYYGY